ncbi:MAG: exodeoxyribonuclease VII large subunit [Micavibrio sp.]|nr:exodeoxyribonuclease VII large subunit [Micavibrio sp.]
MDDTAPTSNVPEFSVGDLAFSVKRTLEDTFGRVRVRGELGRVTLPRSGHLYTNLKDDNASIDAVCWKGALSKLSVKPEEGLEVIVTGRMTTYPASSKYQLVIESMELAGEGALLKMLEERKKKLSAEGLFALERKRALPFLPNVIGVVTSSTGAVIRDILHRLEDRFPRHVLVWPVLVQGQGAAEQVAAAIEGFNSLSGEGISRPDILIVARGGGSLEDLMPFNEEIVVRAVANSGIPVISAVGHETDTTLCDLAADLRAPTPTGAAEKAVPVRAQLEAQVLEGQQRLHSAIHRMIGDARKNTENYSARLGAPERLLEGYAQRLDLSGERLGGVYREYLSAKKQRLIEMGAALRHPQELLNEARGRAERQADQLKNVYGLYLSAKKQVLTERSGKLAVPQVIVQHAVSNTERWGERLVDHAPNMIRNFETKLEHFDNLLNAYSPKNVLSRGYALVMDDAGHVVQNGKALGTGANIRIHFKDDVKVDAVVGKGAPDKAKAKTKVNAPSAIKGTQESLF